MVSAVLVIHSDSLKAVEPTEVHVSLWIKLPTEYVGTWAEAGGEGTVGVVMFGGDNDDPLTAR